MKVLLLGSTGQTGTHLIDQALAAGHQVRAFARDAAKINKNHKDLEVYEGDALDQAAVEKAVQGVDAVICTVGGGGLKKHSLREDITKNTIAAMKKHDLRRLVVMSSMGVGKSAEQIGQFARMVLFSVLRHAIADHEAQEKLLKESGLDWIIVRPSGLMNGVSKGEYKIADESDKSFKASRIPRVDVANFLIDCLESETHLEKCISIS